jgi:hypothetical protein
MQHITCNMQSATCSMQRGDGVISTESE